MTFKHGIEAARAGMAKREADLQATKDRARHESEEQIRALAQACAKERDVLVQHRVEATIGYCEKARPGLEDSDTDVGLWVCAFRWGQGIGRNITYKDSAFTNIGSKEVDVLGEYRSWALFYWGTHESIESVLSSVAADFVSKHHHSTSEVVDSNLQRQEAIVTIGWFGRKFRL